MGKIFNDLTYSNYVPTYVGKPLAAIDQTAGVLEEKFYANKDAYDKALVAVTNLQLNEQDTWRRDEAAAALKENTKAFIDNGDWENASMHMRNEALKIATNEGIRESLKSYQGKQTSVAAIKERVGKSEDEGGILEEDYQIAVARGEKIYKEQNGGKGGVYFDEATKTWKGHWGTVDPPKYINIGDRADKFLKEMKPDAYLGRLTDEKGNSRVIINKNGKLVWAMEEMSKEGTYSYIATTEEVPYEQALQAARAHIMQSEDIQARIEWDASKNTQTLEEWAAKTGQTEKEARTALTEDLVNIMGYNQNTINKMSNEQLKALHNKETVIYNGISGAVAKHSYTQEKMQLWGETFMVKRMRQAAANATAGGGNGVTTVQNNRILHEHYTNTYKLDNPNGLAEITRRRTAAVRELEVHTATRDAKKAEIDRLSAELKSQGLSKENIDAKLANHYDDLNRIQNNIDIYNNAIKDADVWEKYALDELKSEYGESVVKNAIEKKEELYTKNKIHYGWWGEATGEAVQKAEQVQNRLTNFFTADGLLNLNEFTPSSVYSSNPRDWHKVINGYLVNEDSVNAIAYMEDAKNSVIDALKAKNLYTTELATKIEEDYKDLKYNVLSDAHDKNSVYRGAAVLNEFSKTTEGQIIGKVDGKLKELAKNSNYRYTHVDLSSDPTNSDQVITKFDDVTGRSGFTGVMTKQLRNNPNSYKIVGSDGKVEPFNQNKPQYDPLSTIVTGITEEYVPGIGYCMVAKEWERDAKGEIIPNKAPRELLLQPQEETAKLGMIQSAIEELKTGTFVNEAGKIGGLTGYDINQTHILAKILEHDGVDAQLAEFKRFPVERPNPKSKETEKKLTRTIYSGQYEIEVTRKVDLTGKVAWDVNYFDRLNKTHRAEFNYENEVDVQLEIERLGAEKNPFEIPLGGLVSIYDASRVSQLNYAKMNKSKGIAPHLDRGFIQELKTFENEYKGHYNVAYMLRSVYSNERLKGAKGNPSVTGKGIDIFADDDAGLQLQAWLKSNTINGVIKGTKLRHQIIKDPDHKTNLINIYMQ